MTTRTNTMERELTGTRRILSDREEFRQAMVAVAGVAVRSLAIMTRDLESGIYDDPEFLDAVKHHVYRIPITQAVIYGWYDNEMGSYVNMLGDRTVTVAEHMM